MPFGFVYFDAKGKWLGMYIGVSIYAFQSSQYTPALNIQQRVLFNTFQSITKNYEPFPVHNAHPIASIYRERLSILD